MTGQDRVFPPVIIRFAYRVVAETMISRMARAVDDRVGCQGPLRDIRTWKRCSVTVSSTIVSLCIQLFSFICLRL